MTATTSLDQTTMTTYTYDAANRLLVSLSPGRLISYTWDARGNLVGDGTFTYTYNTAGRMVRAESVTATLVYTYNAQGLRVAQSVDGDETTFVWDQALPLAQVMARSDGTLDLYGLARTGEVQGGEWAYPLPDAPGSVRRWSDSSGAVTYAGGYTLDDWFNSVGSEHLELWRRVATEETFTILARRYHEPPMVCKRVVITRSSRSWM